MSNNQTEATATTTPSASGRIAAPRQIEKELADLTASGWNLGESHRKLYRAIRSDPSAARAFAKLTTGSRAIKPVILLLDLELECSSRAIPREYWDHWKDKWEGLGRTAKSLKRIAVSMEKQIQRNPRGPIALPTLLPTTDGEAEDKQREEYARSIHANFRLTAIAASLRENASEIERFCQMRRDWLRKMPRKYRDTIRREHQVLFLGFVKARTGRSHFEDLAALLNVCKAVSQPKDNGPEFSADYFRKLSNRFSTPLTRKWQNSSASPD